MPVTQSQARPSLSEVIDWVPPPEPVQPTHSVGTPVEKKRSQAEQDAGREQLLFSASVCSRCVQHLDSRALHICCSDVKTLLVSTVR